MITGAAAFLHSFLELSSYTIMGAGGRSGGVGSIDEPDSSAWLSVWGSVCVSVWFFDVGYVKTFEIQHCDSSGERICSKMEEEKGPGW